MLGAVLTGAVVASASAQAPAPATWPEGRPADAGVSDVDPLAESFRLEPIDLRVGAGFDRVYRYGVETESGVTRELFARSDGAVTAVFPRSDYAYDRYGRYATIPADTTFVIGGPPAWLLDRLRIETPSFARAEPQPRPVGAVRIDESLDLRIELPAFEAADARHVLPDGSSMTVGGVEGELNRRTVRILMRWASDEALKRRDAPADDADDGETSEPSDQAEASEPATADR